MKTPVFITSNIAGMWNMIMKKNGINNTLTLLDNTITKPRTTPQ